MITIKLRDPSGVWHTFTGDTKLSITEQCERQGIDSPFACRSGACTTCACRIVSGGDNLIQNRFGQKLVDIDKDQFLACIGGVHEGRAASNDNFEVVLDYFDGQ